MDVFMRSALFIPANNPGMLQSSVLLEADGIIYDLEDAISINQKDSARHLLEEYFKNFAKDSKVKRIVRVNPTDTPFFKEDVAMIKKYDVDYIMLAKASTKSVQELCELLKDTKIEIIALIESAYAVFDLRNILESSPLIKGLLFGAEDYSLDMEIKRTKESDEILEARQMIAITAHALNIFCLDTPFTDIEDFEWLIKDSEKAKNYGFSGKACINPRQVVYVNEIFSPTQAEIVFALEVIDAAKKAAEEGLGVFNLNGKMVDAPIINRAKLTLENAKKAGIKYE